MSNVAVVVLDAMRKDTFDEYFDWLPGTHYDSAWAPSAWTVPVHGSLFGGAYPSELGVYARTESLTCDGPVLAEALSEAGYTTRGFSANANISEPFDFDRGFDAFEHSWRGRKHEDRLFDWSSFISQTRDEGASRYVRALVRCVREDVDTWASIGHGIRLKARDMGVEAIAGADDGAEQFLETLRETDFGDDEFYFANLMEAHGPYSPPAEYQTTDYTSSPDVVDTMFDGPEESAAVIRQAYDDSARYLADVYRDIFAELRAEFDCVITLGDHGEMFGRDGAWAHNHGVYPELCHVPLHVYHGEDGQRRHEGVVSLFDVHRTVLDLASREDVDSRGENLLADPPARPLLVERFGLRSKRIANLEESGVDPDVVERYDRHLTGVVIPPDYYGWETLDGFRAEGETDEDPQELRDALVDELDRVDVSVADDGDVPDDVQRRLEELGYA